MAKKEEIPTLLTTRVVRARRRQDDCKKRKSYSSSISLPANTALTATMLKAHKTLADLRIKHTNDML
jgi:hypothetical protein